MESVLKHCAACLSGVFKDLLEAPSDTARRASGELPRPLGQTKPKPILDRTELPDAWKRSFDRSFDERSNGSRAELLDRKDSSFDGSTGQRKALGRHTASLPLLTDSMESGAACSLRCDAIEEQLVELRLSSSSGSGKLQAASSAAVVFVDVPVGATSEFRLDGNKPKKEDRGEDFLSIPFVRTGLEPGVYSLYFLVDGVRHLSKAYPIIGDVNMAIFSNPLRRYIGAHHGTVKDQSGYPATNGFHQASSTSSGSGEKLSNKRKERLERGMSSMKRNHSIQGVYQAGEEAILGCHESNVPMFSDDVYAAIYDHELILRLDSAALHRFDWEAAPLGGPCLGAARLWAGSARLGKKLGECEDACFVSHCALGVADGVGGMSTYADFGMNSAVFAAELMQAARDACLIGEEQCAMLPHNIPPEECALNAVRVANEKACAFGASTIAVAVVSQGTLGVANLGDSGFMVLRRGRHGRLEIVSRSREQHHRWNCPYQLTRLPQSLSEKFPGFSCDLPEDCQRYSARLHQGDLVLMFSDGLKDNLHDHELLHIAERSLPPMVSQLLAMPKYKTAPDALAQALVQAAHERSCDPKARVPFGAYCREHGFSHEGGKLDDITVVAAWVLDQGSPRHGSL